MEENIENYVYNLPFDRAEMHKMCIIMARKYLKTFLEHYLNELTYFWLKVSTKGTLNSVSIATGQWTITEIKKYKTLNILRSLSDKGINVRAVQKGNVGCSVRWIWF